MVFWEGGCCSGGVRGKWWWQRRLMVLVHSGGKGFGLQLCAVPELMGCWVSMFFTLSYRALFGCPITDAMFVSIST